MSEILRQIEALQIVPVVAIPSVELAIPLAEALEKGDLPCAEITLRTEAGLEAIRGLADRPNFMVGAGTVHSVAQAQSVADAGAKFVVTPGLNPKTVAWCLDNNVTIIPGVSSPTDLEMALEFGLGVVKFFPAEACGGIKMLKALSGPYGGVRFMPTGGISPDNLRDYLRLPSVIACGGSWMVKSDLIASTKFDEITKRTAAATSLLNHP
jgi:2-dehydro-3-deoxyphosphogluconate aldolase/(4S)-4-hydroxy-2-oxoglutarate aldolase